MRVYEFGRRVGCISMLALIACGGASGAHDKTAADGKSDEPTVTGDPAHNLLAEATFEKGVMLPWNTSFSAPAAGKAAIKDGALCVNVDNPGKDRWDAQVRHRAMVAQKGHEYTLSFKVWAKNKSRTTIKFGMSGPPYSDYFTKAVKVSKKPRHYGFTFTMDKVDDPTVELSFHLGGQMQESPEPNEICFDDIVLSDKDFTPPPPPPPVVIPKVRVNQVGYLPKAPKIATLVSASSSPEDWSLQDASGKSLLSGKTTVFGKDTSSGDNVHVIDFSAYTTGGKGLVLVAGKEKSDPFDIDANLYKQLKLDAFRYFYHNRSGIEIKMPFAVQEKWARPAGHPKDVAACGPDIGCNYKLDVTGGWYDAGDQGKYVVNGGISVWTLMNWYERTEFLGDKNSLMDQKGLIPEGGNKIPDVLDEARWEMEFLLRMQATEGKYAGMAHHKMHDIEWTALGTAPHEDKVERQLRDVSTAATLNLAATAAQAARIWQKFDKAFADRCLAAAEKAWKAAKANPDKLYTLVGEKGGGPYDDKDVSDEFYWAAAELFVTTGKPEYREEVTKSKHDQNMAAFEGGEDSNASAMSWGKVDALGRISMAVVPSKLNAKERDAYKQQIIKTADTYAKVAAEQGYRMPFRSGKDGYPWGSNSFILNNAMIIALGQDLAKDKDPARFASIVGAMDYILGRNGLGQSYVTGWGERPLKNPHHRFWAHQANAKYPEAPPGAVSGGPNTGLQDPYVQAAGLTGCAPQKCFADHIEAWSTNEITINWNGPLYWVTAWLDEHAK